MSYDNIGLNSLLQSNDSLAAGTREFTSSVDFDTRVDLPTNYIGSANIRNFNFSQGSGGTLTLGGTLNGDGVLSVLNNSGGTVVSLNNTGISVTNGSISIQNVSGSNSFDSKGLVSVANFTRSVSVSGGNQVISGTAETQLTGGTISFVLDRTTNVLYLFDVLCYLTETGTTDTCNGFVEMKVNGVSIEGVALYSGNNQGISLSCHEARVENAGTINLTADAFLSIYAGTPTMFVSSWQLTKITLGT